MKDIDIITMFRNIATNESEYAPTFTVHCLLEVDVTMKGGHTITIYCGETTLVDCSGISPNGHFGIDAIMIKPICDIKKIDLKMRQ